ncbi:trypsin-like serine protease [Paenibacillus antri]|uniref:Trypsin-like serine protease n=1 Tax=Paenibacillus antri TaxID=2582848 RepID=A0A5R9G5Z6_9BACL|nr:trypsin-like peptidase domain-containing protein [Paenibacillus antri]TLS49756.1 trypsin-like serine protease [Paenibacillus antri]
MKPYVWKVSGWVAAVAVTATIAAQASAAGAGGQGTPITAKEINGEVYLKAKEVLEQFGGSGIYNQKDGKFVYVEEKSVSAVVEKVSPAVVAIIGRPSESDQRTTVNRNDLIHGTGFIVKTDGWILTNAHVVKDLKEITVVTAAGKTFAGKRTHIDEESDLALVKIEAKQLPVAAFSKTDAAVGESVVAIGTPISFALRNSISVGVVSGVQRSLHSKYMLLQTDAAINPGNSGGPLVNLNGEVVGINTLKFAAVGVENLGFSIPADTAEYVMKHFFAYGKVKRPSLGVELEESWAALIGLPTTDPLKVKFVSKDSPAQKAGIKAGDVIYSINDVNVNTLVGYNELLKNYLPGDKAKIMLMSNGDLIRKEVTFGEAKELGDE